MTIYHVSRDWESGQPLKSLAALVEWDDDVAAMLIGKWDIYTTDKGWDYYCGDGREVHCHTTLEEAIAFRDEYAPNAKILAIVADELTVRTGSEYPHPVVRDQIPPEFISEIK